MAGFLKLLRAKEGWFETAGSSVGVKLGVDHDLLSFELGTGLFL